MSWKDYSYRRKGGVIGINLGVLLSLYLSFKFANYQCHLDAAAKVIENQFNNVGGGVMPCHTNNILKLMIPNTVSDILGIIVFLLLTYAIGAGIGWIIDKKRKQPPQPI